MKQEKLKPVCTSEDCCHLDCRFLRKEISLEQYRLLKFNMEFRWHGLENWFRFKRNTPKGSADRRSIARIYWVMKQNKTFEIMPVVFAGIQS